MRWAARMRPWFGVAKVGLELFSAAGPPVVAELIEAGFSVFVDMKLADIPTTTRRAARVLGALGASYLTIHTFAGPSTLMAGVEGLAEGAEQSRPARAGGAGDHHPDQRRRTPRPNWCRARVAAARDAGCGGVVCAASDLSEAKSRRARAAVRRTRHQAGRDGQRRPEPRRPRPPRP